MILSHVSFGQQNCDEKGITTDWLGLGKITTIQQEKIEELFLHLIEMEKRITELEKENQSLKSAVML